MNLVDAAREAAVGILNDVWKHWIEAAVVLGVFMLFKAYCRWVMR